jgi:ATP-dependent Lon protease
MANFFDFNADFSPVEEESELIPLMTSDDEEAILKESLPESVPILPLRNAVLFPGVVIPISAQDREILILLKKMEKKL